MTTGFLSLPTELICHILFLLIPRDICRCITTCKTICDVAHSSPHIQYKLELYLHGFMETATLDAVDVYTKTRSLKKSASLWQSNFYAKTVFEQVVAPGGGEFFRSIQSVKCGVWWVWAEHTGLLIRDCNANVELSRTWPTYNASTEPQSMESVCFDPLQDLFIRVSSDVSSFAVNAQQDCNIFQVDIQLVVPTSISGLSMRFLRVHTLECTHTFHESGHYSVFLVYHPVICGERVVLLYFIDETKDLFIQVIDWKKGHAKSYPLCAQLGEHVRFCLLDKQTMVVISGEGRLMLYTLRELDGSPQHRVTYLLPELLHNSKVFYVIHSTPLFHGTAARPGLIPGYVSSLESQIIVLEVVDISPGATFIFVIDAAIFSERAIQSQTPVEIPWSDWGPQYTCCFPRDRSHRISVFGSKMAIALPRDCTPEPGEWVEGFTDYGHFYVHIWDFNKRAVARAKDANNRKPPIYKPRLVAQSCFVRNMFADRCYTATVCRTPFMMRDFRRLFLEEDRLTLTWGDRYDSPFQVDIQVISPVQTEDGTDLAD